MMVVGIAGVVASFATYLIVRPSARAGDFRLFVACLVLQLTACIVYWQHSISFGADAIAYYNDPLDYNMRAFTVGTVGVTQFVQLLRHSFKASYLETFLLFQVFGMVGLVFILRMINEIQDDLGCFSDTRLKLLILLPGFHFWTAFVGKDPIVFMAACMSLWAMMNITRRAAFLILAILLMALVRPHIATISIFAAFTTIVFDQKIPSHYKTIMILVAFGVSILVLRLLTELMNVSALSPDAVTDILAKRQEVGLRKGEDVMNLAFPLRVLTLLFRPFFFDASGVFAWIVSVENIVWVVVLSTLTWNTPTLLRLWKSVPYVRFSIIFIPSVVLFLSLVNFNVGLGLRQKFMVLPASLLLYVTLILYRKASKGSASESSLGRFEPQSTYGEPR